METLIIFGMPVAIVAIVSYFRYKTRQLAARSGGDQKQIEALRNERKQLEARVQNLESIVCSVDFELNARLNRLAAGASQLALPAVGGGITPPPASAPTIKAPASTAAGTRIANRFVLERELGRGAMGAVYLARDEQLGERVALKIIQAHGAVDPHEAAERFRREVSAARKITHPTVIRIHDLIEDSGNIYLSMEYVEGMTLATYLGRQGPLRIDEARLLLGQICDGLGAAHLAGVIHRDLKPGNVLLDVQKRIKLIDFGLAKATFLAGMTATGLILGTPEYMAPEQARGLPTDPRTDVYAIGALAYHMVTGRPPFTGETPIAVAFSVASETPRPPRQLRPELPETFEAAILRALDKDPGKRPQDTVELKKALS
jgi:serine/threonine-protein kinase